MNQPVKFLRAAKMAVLLAVLVLPSISHSQGIEDEFDALTSEWLNVSGELKTYSGLERFCTSADFREQTVTILGLLHHYDSLILEVLLDPSSELEISHKEYKHTIKDIQQFEEEYGIRDFISFLRRSCGTWKDLEKSKDVLKKESGMYSYDGQLLVLETEIRKFLKHIDKKVVDIDDHVHLIHIDQVRTYNVLGENQ